MDKKESCFNCLEEIDRCECGETETFSTDKPHCPYCGARNGDEDDPDPRYYEDGDFHNECLSCGKEYELSVHVSQSYTCKRKDGEL